jgi:glycogen debranching enzyme
MMRLSNKPLHDYHRDHMPQSAPMYSIDTYGQFQPFADREWLLTNGLGGYASSSVIGCNIRKYHGLLIAATLPPVGRINTLSRIGEMIIFDDAPGQPHELGVNQFRDSVHPHGERYLRKFELEDTATWHFEIEGAKVTKELLIPWMRNAVGIRYTIDPTGKKLEFRAAPFFAMRDFHSTRHANGYDLPAESGVREVTVTVDGVSLNVVADGGNFVKESSWWYGHVYPIETDRGQDDSEDLFCPGRFVIRVEKPTVLTIWATTKEVGHSGALTGALDWSNELLRRKEAVASASRVENRVETPVKHGSNMASAGATRVAAAPASATILKLARAANDFVVYRKSPDGTEGKTVIAGYPWFGDWGRDTMIALPGLMLTTGRYDEAKKVLSVFADYVSEGMIPNRFNDYTNEPEYNTVDASLWFIHACFEYLKHSKDQATFDRALKPACRKIIDGYRKGTRYGIGMDEADGLITQGDVHTQLTWMDAKCGDIAFTPRQGKPVEINALWYHGLVLMGETELAKKVAQSFQAAFWISPFRGLADVVTGNANSSYQRDASIRPNQIFAASLSNSPLTPDQQSAVVEVVRRELLTPVGLRTLARSDPKYHGKYTGVQFVRDEAYHNGTIWPWPVGAFLEAYLRVNHKSPDAIAQARRWLSPLIDHLDDACIGQISEIFEADEPHRPVGCCAQAWSVAEVLRLAVELGM